MREERSEDFFGYIDRKIRERAVLEGQIARLEKHMAGLSCWSRLWGAFNDKIKQLQIDLAYLDREIQQYTESFN